MISFHDRRTKITITIPYFPRHRSNAGHFACDRATRAKDLNESIPTNRVPGTIEFGSPAEQVTIFGRFIDSERKIESSIGGLCMERERERERERGEEKQNRRKKQSNKIPLRGWDHSLLDAAATSKIETYKRYRQ